MTFNIASTSNLDADASLRTRHRAVIEDYMSRRGEGRLTRYELFAPDGVGGLWASAARARARSATLAAANASELAPTAAPVEEVAVDCASRGVAGPASAAGTAAPPRASRSRSRRLRVEGGIVVLIFPARISFWLQFRADARHRSRPCATVVSLSWPLDTRGHGRTGAALGIIECQPQASDLRGDREPAAAGWSCRRVP